MDKRTALNKLVQVLNRAADGRITRQTLDYYRSLPVDDDHIIHIAQAGDVPIGVAACSIGEDGEIDRAIVAVVHSHRRKGYGKALVQAMIADCENADITFKVQGADDNESSKKLAESLGLFIIKQETAYRGRNRNERFTRNTYGTEEPEDEVEQDSHNSTVDGAVSFSSVSTV